MSKLIGEWDKLLNELSPTRMQNELHKAAAKTGNYGASEVKKGIQSGAPGGKTFAPLHPATIAQKGSSKPLINKGDLIGNVTYEVLDPDAVFIGVKRTAKNRKGMSEVHIALVHEFGCTMAVTPKMRAYLHYHGIHLNKTTQYINIPARPFLRPILNSNDFREKIASIYMAAIREAFMTW